MKKILLLTAVILMSASCIRETYELHEGARLNVQYITIQPREWVANSGFASVTYRMDMITSAVINRGAVLCYFVNTDDIESPLPFIVTQVDNDFIFTNTLSFDVGVRSIRFISENSDLVVEFPTRPITIKVVTIVNP